MRRSKRSLATAIDTDRAQVFQLAARCLSLKRQDIFCRRHGLPQGLVHRHIQFDVSGAMNNVVEPLGKVAKLCCGEPKVILRDISGQELQPGLGFSRINVIAQKLKELSFSCDQMIRVVCAKEQDNLRLGPSQEYGYRRASDDARSAGNQNLVHLTGSPSCWRVKSNRSSISSTDAATK